MTEAGAREPRSAAAELFGLVLGIECLLWRELLPGNQWIALPTVVLLGALCWRSHTRRRRARSEAVKPAGTGGATLLTLLATAVAALAVLLATRWIGWWSGDAPRFDAAAIASWGDLWWWGDKGAAVLLQQLLLQLFVAPLLLEITGRRTLSLVLAGVLFGGVHLPNPALSVLTLIAAPVWCWLYLRSAPLAPLILSHLLLAILVRGACGDAIYNMRVGASVLPLLPRVVAAADGSTLRVTPRSLEGYVDWCEAEGGRVVCSGWSADVDARRPSDGVAVLASGTFRRFALSGEARADVADSFGMPQLLRVGFVVELPLDSFESSEAPRFFAVAGMQAAELEYLTDRRVAASEARER